MPVLTWSPQKPGNAYNSFDCEAKNRFVEHFQSPRFVSIIFVDFKKYSVKPKIKDLGLRSLFLIFKLYVNVYELTYNSNSQRCHCQYRYGIIKHSFLRNLIVCRLRMLQFNQNQNIMHFDIEINTISFISCIPIVFG
ncbi:predicted protein [Methanosarcina acetivorans C2A]|uniref:Uncharacterized protein n=1 Tax=Methanosarcina acetivorans (strain ATCC 35395 / DSM 2834 / JCM 12185 / C2A) TaxID=188937 RepID=Q8TH83_METAC|nr:predicted protein [Methanosarcina acetivorans C2A]